MIRLWWHQWRGHPAQMYGAGHRYFYECPTCARGWGHRCNHWCGFCRAR